MATVKKDVISEKRLQLTYICILVGYLIPAIWFASALDTRVANLEHGKIKGAVYIERLAKTEGDVVGIKVELAGLKDTIGRIDKNVLRIADKMYEEKR